ncbi:MAG TPA: hypothetical protein VE650_16305, partial [Acetobacteraceae bacterium]|nr:hypothetical protein [Acetobacteraceae bacterium]
CLGGNVGSASLTSASGTLITLGAGGKPSVVSGASIDHWAATGSGSTIALNSLIGGKPYNGIIGAPDASGNYNNANASVYQHLPDIQGTGTFIIAAPGVTSSTQITAATFGFGTTACVTLCGTEAPTVDTNTVTATGTAGTKTVSDTATASVTVGACAPSSNTNLFTAYTGTANQLQLQYKPGLSVATLNEDTVAGATGKKPGNAAFIVLSDKAGDYDGTAHIFYSGAVTSGANIVADASSFGGFATGAGSFLFAHIFANQSAYNNQAAATQEIKYDVSGAHAIALGDTIGSLQLIGYASTTNQGYFS